MISRKKLLLLVLLVSGVVLLQPVLAADTASTSMYTVPTTVTWQTVSATASPTEGMAPLTVQFKDTSKIYSMYCQWNFGDGTSVNGNLHTVNHTYSKAGTYSVSLTIQDPNFKYITSQVATIVVKSPPGPKAGMILVTSCTPFSIQVKDNSTGNPTSWSWNFGDGTTSTLKNPTYIYNSQPTGPITISLTVSNQWGTDTTSQTIYTCAFPMNVTTYAIRTWSTDGEFPAANVDVWYTEANFIPVNPTVTSPFQWNKDEHYLGKTDSNGVLSQVQLPDSWVVIRTQSPDYSKDCVNYVGDPYALFGGWYYTANNIVNVSGIRSKSCHDININLKNRYPSYITIHTPTPTPTVTFTVIPIVTITTIPSVLPWP